MLLFFATWLAVDALDASQQQSWKHLEEKLQTGDIVCRYGTGVTGRLIVTALNETTPISHCGIVVKTKDGSLRVIHAVSSAVSDQNGMQECSFQTFANHARDGSLRVVRYRNLSAEHRRSVATKALDLLKKQVAFDHDFNVRDHSTIYCSELIYMVFGEQLQLVDFSTDKGVDEGVFGFEWASDTSRFSRIYWNQN